MNPLTPHGFVTLGPMFCRRSPAAMLAAGLVLATSAAHAQTVYFVVGEITPYHHDSYVLPLSEADDIAHARALIEHGPGIIRESIVVAEIAAGSDGINRNTMHPDQPLWSWHVSEFYGFAEMTIEVCDGWPTLVEENVDYWVHTVGQVCFWSYTVVEEIAPDCNHNGYLDEEDIANGTSRDCDANGVPDECQCLGDIDGDGQRDLTDFNLLSNAWLTSVGDPGFNAAADLNGDGTVDFIDFTIFSSYWLIACP